MDKKLSGIRNEICDNPINNYICGNLWIKKMSVDEITRNNSQVHDDSFRFGNRGVGNAVPLQRGKFEGVNAEDWPYTTETPENN